MPFLRTKEVPCARSGTFLLQRLKVFGCNNPLDAHKAMIAQFLNLNSLAFSNIVNTRLTPLIYLKLLGNLVLKKSKFICATELQTSISKQLNSLNIVDVSDTDCNFISVNCQSLSCLLCFQEVEEICLSCEYRQTEQLTLAVPAFPNVGSLQLFLRDPHDSYYIVTDSKHLRSLNIKS